MRTRISLLWDRWVSAAKNLTLKQDFSTRHQQRVSYDRIGVAKNCKNHYVSYIISKICFAKLWKLFVLCIYLLAKNFEWFLTAVIGDGLRSVVLHYGIL